MPEMDDYGRHEVMHMASYLAGAVGGELCEHEQITSNKEWEALATKAHDALWELYQSIAKIHLADK